MQIEWRGMYAVYIPHMTEDYFVLVLTLVVGCAKQNQVSINTLSINMLK